MLADAAAWVLLDRESLDWHGAATLATPASRGRLWLMTLFIQRAGHRDTQAIQAKARRSAEGQQRRGR